MGTRILLILSCTIVITAAWSPYYPGPRGPMRFTRFAPSPHQHRQYPHPHIHTQIHPHLHTHVQPHQHPQLHSQPHSQPHLQPEHKNPVESAEVEEKQRQRPKRGHDYDHDHHHDHDHDHDHRGTSGVTGPVHTFVKTDKNANYKWGVRHHVGDKYAS